MLFCWLLPAEGTAAIRAVSTLWGPVPQVLPVLHNLLPAHAEWICASLPPSITACTVSFRHAEAAAALGALSEAAPACGRGTLLLGASSIVSERHCNIARDCGAVFLSTMFFCPRVLEAADLAGLPVLTGVQTAREAAAALQWPACAGLKFYPASVATPSHLREAMRQLEPNVPPALPVFVAGGLTAGDFAPYLAAGATGFAIGVDCARLTGPEVSLQLRSYVAALEAALGPVARPVSRV